MDEEERLRLEEIRRQNAERAQNNRMQAARVLSTMAGTNPGLAAGIMSGVNRPLAGGVMTTVGSLISGVGGLIDDLPVLGGANKLVSGPMVRAGTRISDAANDIFPESERAAKSALTARTSADEFREKYGAAPEGASLLQRGAQSLAVDVISEYYGAAKALSGDTVGYLQHLGDSALRNAPNTGAAMAASLIPGGAAVTATAMFATSYAMERGALEQELDRTLEAEGRPSTYRERAAVRAGSTIAAGMDYIGNKALMGAASNVKSGIPTANRNKFMRDFSRAVGKLYESGKEIPMEMGQEIVANLAQKWGWDPEISAAGGIIEAKGGALGTSVGFTAYGMATESTPSDRPLSAGIASAGISDIMEDAAVEQAMIEDPEGTIETVLTGFMEAGQQLPTPNMPGDIVQEPRNQYDTVYHGTNNDFAGRGDSFIGKIDTKGLGAHFGTSEQANSRMENMESVRQTGRSGLIRGEYGSGANVIPALIDVKNPYRMNDVGRFESSPIVARGIEQIEFSDQTDTESQLSDKAWKKMSDLLYGTEDVEGVWDVMDTFEDIISQDDSPENEKFLKAMQEILKEDGFDGIVYTNLAESESKFSGGEGFKDSYIVFDAKQAQSAYETGGPVKEVQSTYERGPSGMPNGATLNRDGTVTVNTLRNTEKAPAPGPEDTYLQNVEPAGQYMTQDELPGDTPPAGWEQGTKTFVNPLMVDFESTVEGGWKRQLSDKFDGKTGADLSKAVADAGYDGIITTDESGNVQEMVDIGEFSVVKTARELSNIDIMNNPDYSWPADIVKRARRTKRDVANLLEKRGIETLKKAGLKPGDLDSQENRDLISHAIAQELVAASKSSNNALDWYSSDMEVAMGIAGLVHPELAENRAARVPFLLAMAITSQNESVGNNLRQAEKQYQIFKETGRFDPTQASGSTGKVIGKNLEKANFLIDELGIETFEMILNEEFTAGELSAAGHPVSGELMETTMYGSSIFGPKVGGGFFQNLSGNYDPLTMDMWFMRGIGRLRGKLVAGSSAGQRTKLTKRLDFDLKKGTHNWLELQPTDTESHGQTEFTKENIADEEVLYDLAKRMVRWHDRQFKEFRAEYDAKKRKKPAAVFAAEAIVKAGNPVDAPANGTERVALRDIFSRAREIAAGQGVQTTNADAQALWWFPEKDLYSQLGYQHKAAEPTSYSAEITDLARKRGITDEQIQESSERSRLAHRERVSPAGQESGRISPEEKRIQSRVAKAWLRLNIFKGFKRSPAEGETEGTFFTQLKGNASRVWVQHGNRRVESIAGWKPGVAFKNRLEKARADAPPIYELDTSGEGGQLFHDAIAASKEVNKYGAAVYVYSPEEYSQMRLFMTKDGLSGFALKGDDIVSGFSTKEGARSAMLTMLELGAEQGGRKLDAFDTVLPHMYALHGFEVVSRLPFNDSKAEEMGWDYETFKEFNNGRPDVVYMAYTGNKSREYRGEGQLVETEAEAVAIQAAAVEANKNTRLLEAQPSYQTVSGQESSLQPAKDNREVAKRRADLRKEVDSLAEQKPEESLNDPYIENRRPPKGKLLARAIARYLKRYKRSAIIGQKIENPQDLVDLMQIYRDPRFETFRIVYVKEGVVVGHDAYSLRLPGVASTTPKTASGQTNVDFIAEAMGRNNADQFYIVHNHPTGNPQPSAEDGQATAQIENTYRGQGRFMGHAVIDSGKAAFIPPGIVERTGAGGLKLNDGAYLDGAHYDMMNVESPEYGSPDMDNPVLGMKVKDQGSLVAIGKMMRDQGARVGNGSVLIVARSSKGEVAMVMQVQESELKGARGMALIRGQAAANGARTMFVVGANLNTQENYDMYESMMTQGFLTDVVGNFKQFGEGYVSGAGVISLSNYTTAPTVAEMGHKYENWPKGRMVAEQEQEPFQGPRARPDLALPGTTEGQKALNEADYIRLFDESLTPETVDAWIADAEAWLERDYDGAMKEVFYTNRGMQSPVGTIAAQMIYSREADAAAKSGLQSDWEFVIGLASRYRSEGTEVARALRARSANWRGDPRQALLDALARPGSKDESAIQGVLENEREETARSPASTGVRFGTERVNDLTGQIDALQDELKAAYNTQVERGIPGKDPKLERQISDLKNKLSKLEKDLRNAKDRLDRANKRLADIRSKHEAKLKSLYAKNARLTKKIQELLLKKGIDVTKGEITPDQARDGLTTIEGAKSSLSDRIYEWYVSSILSGLLTWNANTIGNTLHTAWDMAVQQWVEVGLASGERLLTGNSDGPYAKEMGYLYATMMRPKTWGKALRLASSAYMKETPMVVNALGQSSDKLDSDQHQHAIPGTLGKVVRGWGVGVLLFLDEFSKSLIYDSHLSAYAYRMAKSEGLEGDAMQKRMIDLTEAVDSPAKLMAYDKALYLTFQNDLGKMGKDTQKALKGLPYAGKYVFTFVKTPTNIGKVVARKTPLIGGLAAAWAWKQGNLNGSGRARVAEQLIAASIFSFFWMAVGGEDEEGRPILTAAPPAGAGAREWSERGIQPHSLLINGTYYRYDRFEPIGTVIALVVDTIIKIKGAPDSKTTAELSLNAMELIYGSFMSKSWLTGVSDVMKVMESPDRLPDYVAKKVGSFVPRAAGQFGSASDPYYRDTRVKGGGAEGLADIGRKAAFRAMPYAGSPFVTPPAVDIWGRDRVKDYTGGEVSSFLLRLMLPVGIENSTVFRGDIWISRYNEDFPDEKFFPSLPRPEFTLARKSIEMTDSQYHEFLKYRGELAKEIVTGMLEPTKDRFGKESAPVLDVNAPKRNEKDIVSRAFSAATNAAKMMIAVKYYQGEEWLTQEEIDSITATRPANPRRTQLGPMQAPR